MTRSLLMIDDDAAVTSIVTRMFASKGWVTFSASEGLAGVALYEQERPNVVICDVGMPGVSGIEVLRLLLSRDPDATVIMLTGGGSIEMSVEAMRIGAETFLTKPPDSAQLELAALRANEKSLLRRQTRYAVREGLGETSLESLGRSPMMQHVGRQLGLLAASSGPVLLTGETGTGKGWAAKLVHAASPRAAKPFVSINCAGLTSTFLDTELFGHEKGAFTDARSSKQGLFEVADGGTLFLDEIGDLAPELQPKLLTVLETNRFRRLGATRETQVDVRLIAATHKHLLGAVKSGAFREDLYYRLSVLPVELPALRERDPADLVDLVSRIVAELRRRRPTGPASVSSEALELLSAYPWPGNIRELRNVIERADLIAGEAREIRAEHLPREIQGARRDAWTAPADDLTLESVKRQHVLSVLNRFEGNRLQAAKALGVTRATLYEWLNRWGLSDRQAP
jgi:DNA-binding NtrC family response regulator